MTFDRMSPIGFGGSGIGNEFGSVDDAQADAVVHAALDLGITYFDTSPYYGRTLSEERLGRALRGHRSEVFLATKAGRHGKEAETGFDFSHAGILSSAEASLRRLQTDHVDLLQLHDVEFGDPAQIESEAIPALLALREQGKALSVGVTGYPLPVLADFVAGGRFDFALSYCHYNLLNRRLAGAFRELATQTGTRLINASILHMGVLTDAEPPEWHPAGKQVTAAAAAAAQHCRTRGTSLTTLALQFALAAEWVTATLVGTTKASHLEKALDAADHPPDPALIEEVTSILRPVLDTTWPSGRWRPSEPAPLAERRRPRGE